jgi:hypothetical protein
MNATHTETIEEKQHAADLYWAKVQEARAKNPDFDRVVALVGDRARAYIKVRLLKDDINSIGRQIEDLKAKLSPEERELL